MDTICSRYLLELVFFFFVCRAFTDLITDNALPLEPEQPLLWASLISDKVILDMSTAFSRWNKM